MQERQKRVRMWFVEILTKLINPMGKLLFIVLVSLFFVSACGQKGALYVPVQEQDEVEVGNNQNTGKDEDTEKDEVVYE